MTEITKTALKRIIEEELHGVLKEKKGHHSGYPVSGWTEGDVPRFISHPEEYVAPNWAQEDQAAVERAQKQWFKAKNADEKKRAARHVTGAGWAEKVMSPGKTAGEAWDVLKKGGKAAMDWYKKQGGKPPSATPPAASATPPAATPAKPGKLSKAGRKGLRATIRMLRTTLKALPREKKEERKKIRNQIRQIRKQLGAGRRRGGGRVGRPGNKYFDRGCKVLASRYGKNKDCTGMYHKFYEEVEGVQVGGPIARALGLKDYKWGSKHTKALKMLKGETAGTTPGAKNKKSKKFGADFPDDMSYEEYRQRKAWHDKYGAD